jgi:hypothetical protein
MPIENKANEAPTAGSSLELPEVQPKNVVHQVELLVRTGFASARRAVENAPLPRGCRR